MGGSQFGTGDSAGPPDSTKENAVCDTIGALGWGQGQGQGQAREGSCSWCPNTPENMHCHSSFPLEEEKSKERDGKLKRDGVLGSLSDYT